MLLGLIILLLYNLAGALFLGDAGSYAIGGTIGILMIYCYHRAAGGLPVLAAVLAAPARGRLLARHGDARLSARRSRRTRTISTIASPATGAGPFAWPFTWLWWSFRLNRGAVAGHEFGDDRGQPRLLRWPAAAHGGRSCRGRPAPDLAAGRQRAARRPLTARVDRPR